MGGSNNLGTVFELVNNNGAYTLNTEINFNGYNGEYPVAGLIADANGHLFGTTQAGGPNGAPPPAGQPNEVGTVFEITNSGFAPVPPTAAPDRAHVQEGHSVTADAAHGVLANDTDPITNDALTVGEVDGQASNVGIVVAGAYGKLTLNANGSYTYVATAHDHKLPSDGVGLDTFTYTAKDGADGTADTTLSVVVTAPRITYLGGTANTTIQGGNNVKQVLDGGAGNDVVIAPERRSLLEVPVTR